MFTSKHWVVEYVLMTFGVFLLAMGVSLFYEPNNLVTGGATGLAIALQSLSEEHIGFTFQLWQANILLNLPLFIIAAKQRGLRFLKRSFYCTVLLTAMFYVLEFMPAVDLSGGEETMDMILTALFGGVLVGAGLGIVIVNSSTTGGSDLLAVIIKYRKKHIELGKILFVLDGVVIAFGFFVFGPERTMYAIISVFVISKVITAMEEGLSFSRVAFIISDKSEEIASILLAELDRGATAISGKGMYTKAEKCILMCVVSKKEIVRVKEIVSRADENAFVIVSDAREVLGEGFQKI